MDAALSTYNLRLSYDRTPIIQNLDVEIPSQCITVLVGPNGCGKSTLLKGLARLISPQRGTVYLNQQAMHKLSTQDIAKALGILPQGPVAPEGLTVRSLVAQGRYPHQRWFQQWSKEDEEMTEAALSMTGLLALSDRPLETLSGGQRQRAWIAMALAQNTDIFLLDEPTTFLDLAHQIEILDLLYRLNRHQQRTIIMVLHDLNQACRYADHLVVMRQGQIYCQGSPEIVMTETMVQEVFGLSSCIIADPITGTPMCIPTTQRETAFSHLGQK